MHCSTSARRSARRDDTLVCSVSRLSALLRSDSSFCCRSRSTRIFRSSWTISAWLSSTSRATLCCSVYKTALLSHCGTEPQRQAAVAAVASAYVRTVDRFGSARRTGSFAERCHDPPPRMQRKRDGKANGRKTFRTPELDAVARRAGSRLHVACCVFRCLKFDAVARGAGA